ncbi:MAG: hypothetical protein ACK5NT_05645 [Pyrinomonadaceae bacterium]
MAIEIKPNSDIRGKPSFGKRLIRCEERKSSTFVKTKSDENATAKDSQYLV